MFICLNPNEIPFSHMYSVSCQRRLLHFKSSLLLFILHYICWIATRFGSQSKICENQEINLEQCLYSSFFVKYGYIE